MLRGDPATFTRQPIRTLPSAGATIAPSNERVSDLCRPVPGPDGMRPTVGRMSTDELPSAPALGGDGGRIRLSYGA
jgi:hypothetical protein